MSRARALAVAAALALPAGAAAAAEGFAAAPFHDRPVAAVRAAALELVRSRAAAMARAGGEAGEIAEGIEAERAVLGAGFEEGDIAALDAAAEAELAARPADRGLAAAALAHLLVSEAGLAEAYEEAAEGEAGAYALGEAILGRAEGLAEGLAAEMSPGGRSEMAELLGRLRELMPGPERPERLSPDPEEAETYTQALVGVLERELDIDLYPGRDLARAAGTVRDLGGQGCAEGGAQRLAVAGILYEAALEDMVSVLAAEAGEAAEAGFEAIGAGRVEAGCKRLLPALDEVSRMVGGGR